MPPKKISAPAERIYRSTPVREQVTFKPRLQRIKNRHSLGSAKTRQQTLTQIDFVSLQSAEDIDAEIDAWEGEQRPKKRRRRTEGDAPSRHHTQTLTQLEFVSTPTNNLENEDIQDEIPSEVQVKIEQKETPSTVMGPPTTPRKRIYEIPSSQSPATPQSHNSYGRSPLTERLLNNRMKRENSASPIRIKKAPKLEIQDTFDSEVLDSQASRVSSARNPPSSPAKGVRFSDHLEVILGTPVKQLSAKAARQEIEDSEAESDEETQDEEAQAERPSRYTKPEEETQYGDFGEGTQAAAIQIASSAEDQLPSSPPRLPQPFQASQSQRLSTQVVDSLGPRSDRSDIIIPIHPLPVSKIISREKNHEFRTWLIPSQVSRIWIYETSPASSLKYMASISSVKRPGEIAEDGLGNAEFNTGSKSSYAYEILEIYELAEPIPLASLKANHWMSGAPQKYVYVKPAVLEYLMANLKQSLFTNLPALVPHEPSSTLTESQEAEAQLHSTIVQFTERVPNSSVSQSSSLEDVSTSLIESRDAYRRNVRPSQATTVDLTQPATPQMESSQPSGTQAQVLFDDEEDDTVIPDSPSRGPPSSQPFSFPLHMTTSSHSLGAMGPPLPYPSSQLLTRSQMLPDSLMNNSFPPPPFFVEDSDVED